MMQHAASAPIETAPADLETQAGSKKTGLPPSATLDVEGLFRLAAGKTLSTLIELALELDLFAKLQGRQVAVDELSELWGMPATSARLVAQCLANFGLLTHQDGTVCNGPLAESQLTGDSMLRRSLALPFRYDLTTEELKAHLLDPPPLQWYQLRDEGEITDFRALLKQDPEGWIAALAEQRHEMRIGRGMELASKVDLSGCKKLLDIGGSSGGYCVGIRRVYPELSCVVFDLPEAAEVARQKIEESGESEHIAVEAGSFFERDLPEGADVVLIANVLHLWIREDNVAILKMIYEALQPGGRVLVRETFFEDDWSGPVEAVFDGFILLGKEGQSGWQPSYSDMEAAVAEAGFTGIERHPDLVIGHKP